MNRLLFRGGRLLTPHGTRTADVLVVDGKIDEVYPAAPTSRLQPVAGHFGERVIQLGGRLLTPAFVDAHAHLASTGFASMGADLAQADSAEEALAALAEHVDRSSLPVVLGYGWDDAGWPDADAFTQAAVDAVCGDRPAYLSRVDVHSAVASSALVRQAESPTQPAGWSPTGAFTREAHHQVREAAHRLLAGHRTEALATALAQAAAQGIGLLHELGAPHLSTASDFDAIDALTGPHPLVVGYWGSTDLAEARSRGLAGAAGDLCTDGAIGSRTAALHDAYADDDSRGFLYLEPEAVTEHIVQCTEAGLQAGFHVIGDRAVSGLVDAFEAAASRVGAEAVRAGRHRVEHLEMVTPDQIGRLAELGVLASVQPVFDAWWGQAGGLYEQRLGQRRVAMNPFRTMLEAGMGLAFGSDSPVTPFDPWAAVRAAVNHHDPDQRLELDEALHAHTVGGWQACRRKGGAITPGAPAHLAVWDITGDLDLSPGASSPTCDVTLVGERVAHDRRGDLS